MRLRTVGLVFVCSLVASGSAVAQSFSGDARKVGMGGAGYSENLATRMIEDERPYKAIVIPLGILQAIQDRDRFNPDDKQNFDPALVLEYAASPLHYVIGREPGGARGKFVRDVVNGEVSRDLNSYRGFNPANHLKAEGLASPSWGKTIKFARRPTGAFQGIYIGVGPYLSARTDLNIDQALTDVLASATPVSIPNRTFYISDVSAGQLALAVTGGYRARFAFRSGGPRDGVYVGANYSYLRGFHYDEATVNIRLDTDSTGLVTLLPVTIPAQVDYRYSKSGTGRAVDAGIAVVYGGLELGFGANGLGNRIDWEGLSLRRYTLRTLVASADFLNQRLPGPTGKFQVKLPVDYTGSGAYRWEKISVVAEAANGFQGTRLHSGLEFRLGPVELRGGAGYSLDRWQPAGGIGLNMGQRFSIDVAAYGSTTNLERVMRPAIAVSLRFNRRS